MYQSSDSLSDFMRSRLPTGVGCGLLRRGSMLYGLIYRHEPMPDSIAYLAIGYTGPLAQVPTSIGREE